VPGLLGCCLGSRCSLGCRCCLGSRRGGCFLGGGGLLSCRCGLLRSGGGRLLGSSSRSSGAGADDGEDRANLGGLVLVDADLLQRAGYGGRDFGVHLVGGNLEQRLVNFHGVANSLEPAGDGAFGDALAKGRQGDFVAFTGGGGCCLCGRCFLGRCLFGGCRGCFFGRCCSRFLGGGCCGGFGSAAAGTVTDAHQGGANFSGLVFGDEDFLDDAGDRRGDFSVYFVGGNLEQRFVHLYPVTYLLEPAGDSSFGDALTEGGQVNGFRHVVPVLLIDLKCG
jgi:hypothetical protein